MIASSLVAASVGVLSHVFYFHRGEHHMWPVTYAQIFITGYICSVVALVKLTGLELSAALSITSTAASSYLLGVYGSLLVYRIFLNPLNKFPGPWQARISVWWLVGHLRDTHGYLHIDALHKKYGKFVRVGPNTLSITDPDLHEAAFSTTSKRFAKAEWYDGGKPFDSMHTTRDKALHDRRRRVWAPAFSDKALRQYEPRIKAYNDKLVERIGEHSNGPIDVRKWFNLWSFDTMGQLAFGKDYGMLDSGELHWALDLLQASMGAAPARVPTWAFRVLVAIPFAASGIHKFLKFAHDELEARVNSKEPEGDITGWLLKAYKDVKAPAEDPMFQGDSRLIIVAGSDTTSATMTTLFYYLARNPDEVKKLRDELHPLTAKEDWADIDIKKAQHLNGAIDEALRLLPPVPSGLERLVPEGGVEVNNTFIPAETQFWMPQYCIGRDEENYEKASEFIPERWYSKPDMVKHKNAFAVFSLGAEGCIGKNCTKSDPHLTEENADALPVAYQNMRTLTAQLVLTYDIALAPGEDGNRLLYQTKDHFTLAPGGLDLVFTPASS